MPGQFRCPKCGFQWSIQTICVASGQVGTTEKDRQTPDCPNDGTRMVNVTYREQLEAYAKRLKEECERADSLQKERDGWKRMCDELTPEDMREMAFNRNALLEAELSRLRAELAKFRTMANLFREATEEHPNWKLISVAPALLGMLEPLTESEIKRGQEIAKKLSLSSEAAPVEAKGRE
jgi:hypothetical protein